MYHFISAPLPNQVSTSSPQRFLIFGDLSASIAGPTNTSTIRPYASKKVSEGNFDMILQVGDFAYDFQSQAGYVGRVFMNEIQNMSAFVPFMVCHGSHKAAFNFAHYTEFSFVLNQQINFILLF